MDLHQRAPSVITEEGGAAPTASSEIDLSIGDIDPLGMDAAKALVGLNAQPASSTSAHTGSEV
jgi:hypothetical protein